MGPESLRIYLTGRVCLEADGALVDAALSAEACRRPIAEELGVDPSRQTKAVYEAVLASL